LFHFFLVQHEFTCAQPLGAHQVTAPAAAAPPVPAALPPRKLPFEVADLGAQVLGLIRVVAMVVRAPGGQRDRPNGDMARHLARHDGSRGGGAAFGGGVAVVCVVRGRGVAARRDLANVTDVADNGSLDDIGVMMVMVIEIRRRTGFDDDGAVP